MEELSLSWLALDATLSAIERSVTLFQEGVSWTKALQRRVTLRLRLSTWGVLMSDPVRMDTVARYMQDYVPVPLRHQWLTTVLLSPQFDDLLVIADAETYWRLLAEVPIPPLSGE
jgi:hypothetical protein